MLVPLSTNMGLGGKLMNSQFLVHFNKNTLVFNSRKHLQHSQPSIATVNGSSMPEQSTLYSSGLQYKTSYGPLGDSNLMVGNQPYTQIFDQGGSAWHWQASLAYCDTGTITTVKSFIVKAPGSTSLIYKHGTRLKFSQKKLQKNRQFYKNVPWLKF